MSNVTKIHASKTPIRIHYIVEWAEKRGLKQADIVEQIDADKGSVSRWFSGTLPKPEYLERLADLFGTDIHGLFRHPDDDWIARFLTSRSKQEKERAIDVLKLMFDSDKTGTEG